MGGEPGAGGRASSATELKGIITARILNIFPQFVVYFSRSAQNNPSKTHGSASTANDVRFSRDWLGSISARLLGLRSEILHVRLTVVERKASSGGLDISTKICFLLVVMKPESDRCQLNLTVSWFEHSGASRLAAVLPFDANKKELNRCYLVVLAVKTKNLIAPLWMRYVQSPLKLLWMMDMWNRFRKHPARQVHLGLRYIEF